MGRLGVGLTPEQRAETRSIAAELAAIARSGRVLPGTITKRRTRCGNPRCRCMADPPEPHGPYYQWTRKVTAKTVGRWLGSDQAAEYDQWVDNHRRMRVLLARLEAIGVDALEADPRNTPGRTRSRST